MRSKRRRMRSKLTAHAQWMVANGAAGGGCHIPPILNSGTKGLKVRLRNARDDSVAAKCPSKVFATIPEQINIFRLATRFLRHILSVFLIGFYLSLRRAAREKN